VKVIASQIRKGNVVEVDGQLYAVLSSENFHPGKGTPTTQIDMRRISDGIKTTHRYKTTEQVERAFVEDHDYQYLYADGEAWHFMNPSSFEQLQTNAQVMGDAAQWLKGQEMCSMTLFNGNPIAVTPPNFVILRITQTDPGIRGDTATGGTKPATMETGAVVRVPLFIEEGSLLKIDTRTGEYVSRAKEE